MKIRGGWGGGGGDKRALSLWLRYTNKGESIARCDTSSRTKRRAHPRLSATRGARLQKHGHQDGHRLLTMSHRSRGQANGGGHSKGNSDVAKVSARVPHCPCAAIPALLLVAL